ncbi:Asp23/Gls24 family envelope stress response protein [Rathayibacter iranicus]|uniref:Asp23/Gls24 family envelope stress response protein n=2 Tax=Rathayibacter iranicus TaxID=59737 RepID=A0AAD1ADF0_9MICO|nr:Asp23/Gls24 family envelope stress response protein [Rathayibacter iranicus]AZZ56133.1 Asp23/Gls24 family envelope stress response protein [Rathayibacter iranicus]MWV30171.1 Asp23/Gls24 family envelope stress response protein [Rathayibacter iranicus NCPPB 2253 = VKM Ac-1602]PPI46201.1 Asp23/Gls24 family envelope stress response protein [Rathayibacter iranicus]PPI59575.1 Asp23/Gls24 family envelope stress response protein [Rathayibacter iranicus]PPI71053.1 Asp23/Gls24 family envelope stress 
MSDSTPTPSTARVGTASAGTTTPVDTVTSLGGDAGSGTAQGTTVIDDGVVAKVAGIAAREVPGVYALGNNAARAFGAIRQAVGGADHSQGVSVEVGETQVAADVTVVVEYPVPMQQVANAVRAAVASAITELVGMDVADINIAIVDVHIPGDDKSDKDDESAESRVR